MALGYGWTLETSISSQTGLNMSIRDLYVKQRYPPYWLPLDFAQSACGVAWSAGLPLLNSAYCRIAMLDSAPDLQIYWLTGG